VFVLIPLFLVAAAGLGWWGMSHATPATTAQIAAAQVMLASLLHDPTPGGTASSAVAAFQAEVPSRTTLATSYPSAPGWYDAKTYAAARWAIPAVQWPAPWAMPIDGAKPPSGVKRMGLMPIREV
jgi:hypothetical protein